MSNQSFGNALLNPCLVQMTDDVGELVLKNNYQQTQTLSLAGAQSASMIDVHARLMRDLEQRANLDRRRESGRTQPHHTQRRNGSPCP